MPRESDFTQALCADNNGFSLHAAVRCAANDRQALEQLCRYITRPALANERVQTNAAGQVVLKLKTPWRDGTTHLVMSPLEFMQRLAALVPRPRLHLIRFHGVLAPNAKLRAQVVPQEAEAPAQAAPPAECEPNCAHHRPVRLSWAAQARVRDRHGALPELRRRAEDHCRDPGTVGDREDPHAPGAAGAGTPGRQPAARRYKPSPDTNSPVDCLCLARGRATGPTRPARGLQGACKGPDAAQP